MVAGVGYKYSGTFGFPIWILILHCSFDSGKDVFDSSGSANCCGVLLKVRNPNSWVSGMRGIRSGWAVGTGRGFDIGEV